MNNKYKVLLLALASTLLALLLFMFGITIANNSLVVHIAYYIISMPILVISTIMLYKNNKKYKEMLFTYLMFVNIFFIILITYFVISHI